MAVLKDLYEITSKASTGGIDAAGRALEKNASAIGKLAKAASGIGAGLAKAGLAMQGLKQIGEVVGGLFDKLAETSPRFADALQGVQGVFGQLQTSLLTPIADALTPVLGSISMALSDPAFQKFISETGKALGEIFAQIGGVLTTNLLPVIMQLVQSVLPPVLDLIGVLLPPLRDLLDALLPPLVSIIGRLAEVFGAVLEALAPVVVELAEALIPPILELIDELLPLILPLVEQLAGLFADVLLALAPLISDGLRLLLPLLVDLAETVLPPVLDAITWLAEKVGGILKEGFTWLRNFINNDLGKAFEWLNDKVLKPIVDTFNKVIGVIQDVIGWFTDLWNKIKEGVDALPDWLVPGSPTPFEIGLRGIADALQSLPVPRLGGSLAGTAGVLAPAGAGAGMAPITVNVHGPFSAAWTPYQAGQQAGQGVMDALRAKGYRVP